MLLLAPFGRSAATSCKNRELRQQRRRLLRKRHLKIAFALLQTYRAYSMLFISSNLSEFFRSWILKDSINNQKKRKRVVVLFSRPPQNVKFGSFTSQSCNDGVEMYKKSWCTRNKVVVLLIKPIAFLPFSLTSPSSLLKLLYSETLRRKHRPFLLQIAAI